MKEKRCGKIFGARLAVFDLDGTLFDSTRLWADIDVEFLKKRGHVPTQEYRRGIAALGNSAVAEFTIGYYGLTDTPEALMEEWAGMARDKYAHDIKLFPHAREYLEKCRARGIELVAATSLAEELAVAGLESNGILDMFDAVFTADGMGICKTQPEFYAEIAKRRGAEPSECVAFDDVARALSSAKRAGMRAVLVRPPQNFKEYDDADSCEFDYIVRDFAGAPEIFGA